MMLHTTFRRAREAGACISSYRKIAKALGGVRRYGEDTLIPLDKVLDVCGFEDALWTLHIVVEPADRELRLFACDCAERVLPIFEKGYPNDRRPRHAIEISRLFADGKASKQELATAREAAAWAAWEAARAAGAAGAAAWEAAWDAAWAAWAAGAEREWQTERFREMLRRA